MRVFYAIKFDNETKEYLDTIKNKIRANSTKGNFTNKENFHLTLKFIGEINQNQLSALVNCIGELCSNKKSFTIEFNRLGKFDRGNRCIPWIGIRETEELNLIQSELETILEKEGFKKEQRTFKPHITLGRQVIMNNTLENLYDEIGFTKRQYVVSNVTLMESKRVEGKLVYLPLCVEKF